MTIEFSRRYSSRSNMIAKRQSKGGQSVWKYVCAFLSMVLAFFVCGTLYQDINDVQEQQQVLYQEVVKLKNELKTEKAQNAAFDKDLKAIQGERNECITKGKALEKENEKLKAQVNHAGGQVTALKETVTMELQNLTQRVIQH